MPSSANLKFYGLKETCIKHFKEKEPWPSYYERRYLEFLTLVDLLPEKRYLKVLELGCGIGYYSAFLSKIADDVLSTDLEVEDVSTHSPGLQTTREFLSGLGIKNVKVLPASAEELPFEDNSFDLVFSSHVIEHIPNSDKAIIEINRVLKPGGINFCVVPTSTYIIYSFFVFYIYLIQRLFVHVYKKIFSKNEQEKQNELELEIKKNSKNHYLKHLPFPPPHGAYPSYLNELSSWTLGNWKNKITCQNKIKLLNQYGLQLNPILTLTSILFPITTIKVYSITRKIENKFIQNPLLKYLGISTGVFQNSHPFVKNKYF